MRNDDVLSTLQKLSRKVPEPQEAHGLVMLLGNGLAEAMVGMRARQATLEAVRAEARGRALGDARRPEAEAAVAAVAAVRAEIRRLRVKEPRTGDGITSVYGHVLDDGEPVARALVALVDGDNALGCIETDNRGSFALSVDSEGPLALQVTVNDAVVHRDEEATIAPMPVAPYRLVELSNAGPQTPTQQPCDNPGDTKDGGGDRPKPKPKPMPRPGGSLTRVLKELRAGNVRVTTVRLYASHDATPRVSDIRHGDDGIELEVHGRVTDAGRLAVVAALLAHQPEAEAAGIGSATAAAALLKAGQVTTWDEARQASRLKVDDVAQRFGLDREQGAALRLALVATLSALDVAEGG